MLGHHRFVRADRCADFLGALIGLALAAAAVVLLPRLESRGVSVLGTISVTMPTLAIPVVSVSRLTSLLSLSLIISVVVMVQTAATTRSFPTDPNEPPDVDCDFYRGWRSAASLPD